MADSTRMIDLMSSERSLLITLVTIKIDVGDMILPPQELMVFCKGESACNVT